MARVCLSGPWKHADIRDERLFSQSENSTLKWPIGIWARDVYRPLRIRNNSKPSKKIESERVIAGKFSYSAIVFLFLILAFSFLCCSLVPIHIIHIQINCDIFNVPLMFHHFDFVCGWFVWNWRIRSPNRDGFGGMHTERNEPLVASNKVPASP